MKLDVLNWCVLTRNTKFLIRLHHVIFIMHVNLFLRQVPKLRELHLSIDDVDFYVGGLFEKPLRGALVGPTFACVIEEAPYRWKFDDRLHNEFPEARFRFVNY